MEKFFDMLRDIGVWLIRRKYPNLFMLGSTDMDEEDNSTASTVFVQGDSDILTAMFTGLKQQNPRVVETVILPGLEQGEETIITMPFKQKVKRKDVN